MVPSGETGMRSIFTVFFIWCGGKDDREGGTRLVKGKEREERLMVRGRI
jgi:hypothetical protein